MTAAGQRDPTVTARYRSNAAEALGLLHRCESQAELRDRFRAAIRPHGFSTYAAGYLPEADAPSGAPVNPKPFLLLDWPGEWLELYARQGFARDDVILAEAARSTAPFTWSEVKARRPGASAHIFAAASGFGWNDGFVVPVHDPSAPAGERVGIVSLAAANLDGFDAAAREGVARLALAAFARARLLARRGDADRPQRLPPREREALVLVAEGLDDAAIAERMRISRATAHSHVESAKRRLGAKSRAQAVAVALTFRLLDPP